MSVPLSDLGTMPARSTASQEISSINRCWGSIASASRGEIPKKSGSNRSAPSMNPPLVT